MDSRFLVVLMDGVYLASIGLAIGILAFVTFGLKPSREAGVPGDRSTGPLAQAYLWASIAAATALPSFLGAPLSFPEYRGPFVGIQALMILGCVLLLLYAANSLTPAITASRKEIGPETFERLERRAKAVNVTVLGLGIALLFLHSARAAPGRGGIVEPSLPQRFEFMEFAKRVNEIVNDQCDRAIASKSRTSATGSFDLDDKARAELLEVSQRFWRRGGSPPPAAP